MNSQTQDLTTRAADDGRAEGPSMRPPVDVFEDAAGITLVADMPGAAKETLSIRVDNDVLTIDAPIDLGEAAEMQPLHIEVRAPHYRRSFTLSRELDTAHVDASLKDGVLRLRVPKFEHAQPRRIDVRAG